ncbi:MAG: AzlD domain-containing protein [Treponema sp.]|jgi:branched-subunit amino acid transport protein AzlD|nr:AzlD domain-containing protein [Treponema sp.]
MLNTGTALLYTVVLGAVIFFCRVLPFILFKDEKKTCPAGSGTAGGPANGLAGAKAFLGFVEKVAPPVAMTVLAFNSLAGPVKEAAEGFSAADFVAIIPVATAALCTAVLHVWKRNALISIFGGTALYMLLEWFIRGGVCG